ncbi:MAG: DUF4215 domain-containing protein [Nanoarchaeota archaeon]|nr:DUF4215 domain-containing protein [Nanoarchaeota archaeon]MBU1321722.1 DUF4215 domain-containing protein [Nanoarchaeota archaeon]MBU1597688.1 DUF4215 domain-containing protein [Nanoarchaeota archaeon]MBU2440750.1 DUF4215 domain-containing protein [Nanoarchaeota archaeon]
MCVGADYIRTVDLMVVGKNCHSSNQISDSVTVSIPVPGKYRVEAQVWRGAPGQCQTNEDFYLKINGATGPESRDDSNPCAISVRLESMGEFSFNSGLNVVNMHTASTCPPDIHPNSVEVKKLCFYKKDIPPPVCGNDILEPGEECESDSHCNDNNPNTIDFCKSNCQCEYNVIPPKCGNGVLETGEECESPSTYDNHYCPQTKETCSGKKLGVRDDWGFCNSGCDCSQDSYSYSCVKDKCNAVCGSNADCNDNNPATIDVCKNDCLCEYTNNPYCGNGVIDIGEECESNSDCSSGEYCSSQCDCEKSNYCGDGNIDQGEECDNGVYNGVACSPGKTTSCKYCDANCELQEIPPGTCGDGVLDFDEQCDAGSSNGNICTPDCGATCYYCDDNCSVMWENKKCNGSIIIPPPPYIPPPTPYCPTQGGCTPTRVGVGVCGNGIIDRGEDCDNGDTNGKICSPPCDGSCTYCTRSCIGVTRTGMPCARGTRPWDTGFLAPYCEKFIVNPSQAYLDYFCGGNHADVTSHVTDSDNFYAKQDACDDGYTYIYLSWDDARFLGTLDNSAVHVEHKEAWASTWLEYNTACCGWQELCQLPVRRTDYTDSCSLEDLDLKNITLRMKIRATQNAPTSFEMLDHAYLNLTYCQHPGVMCGNNLVESGEECDDGNIRSGDGCSQICKLETWFCTGWSDCIGGEQTQTCTYSGDMKVNTRPCPSININWGLIILVLVFLILILLLFLAPHIYLAFQKKE